MSENGTSYSSHPLEPHENIQHRRMWDDWWFRRQRTAERRRQWQAWGLVLAPIGTALTILTLIYPYVSAAILRLFR